MRSVDDSTVPTKSGEHEIRVVIYHCCLESPYKDVVDQCPMPPNQELPGRVFEFASDEQGSFEGWHLLHLAL